MLRIMHAPRVNALSSACPSAHVRLGRARLQGVHGPEARVEECTQKEKLTCECRDAHTETRAHRNGHAHGDVRAFRAPLDPCD